MIEPERAFETEKCGTLLHMILVDIRNLSWDAGNEAAIHELADLAHNLPLFMIGKDDAAVDVIRHDLVRHSLRRWPTSDPEATKYVELWDLSDDEYQQRHRQYTMNATEPVAAAR